MRRDVAPSSSSIFTNFPSTSLKRVWTTFRDRLLLCSVSYIFLNSLSFLYLKHTTIFYFFSSFYRYHQNLPLMTISWRNGPHNNAGFFIWRKWFRVFFECLSWDLYDVLRVSSETIHQSCRTVLFKEKTPSYRLTLYLWKFTDVRYVREYFEYRWSH